MPVLGIMNDHCLVLRAPLITDRYGQGNTRDWDNASALPVSNVSIQPSSTVEDTLDRQTTVSSWRFYGPPGVDVLATDRIQYHDMTLEIIGEPQKWYDPLAPGVVDHIEIPLEIIKPDPRSVK